MTVHHLHTKKAMVGNHSGDTFGMLRRKLCIYFIESRKAFLLFL